MSGYIIVCPFCLTIFMKDVDADDECPECGVGILVEYEEYKLRLNSSFMEYISKDRGTE